MTHPLIHLQNTGHAQPAPYLSSAFALCRQRTAGARNNTLVMEKMQQMLSIAMAAMIEDGECCLRVGPQTLFEAEADILACRLCRSHMACPTLHPHQHTNRAIKLNMTGTGVLQVIPHLTVPGL